MSYVPDVYIRKKDLIPHRSKIEAKHWGDDKNPPKDDATKEAWKTLFEALDGPTITFDEVELICLVSNELTMHNRKLREVLGRLHIEYKTEC